MDSILFTNARVIFPDLISDEVSIFVRQGRIEQIFTSGKEPSLPQGTLIHDCRGNYLSPGFIDLHSHGGGGADVMDGTEEDILCAARMHLSHGTTGYCPTPLTCPKEELFVFFQNYSKIKDQTGNLPHFLGIHLEGPYVARSQAGAQPQAYIRDPGKEDWEDILEHADHQVVRWTIAPELPGAMELADELVRRGVRPVMGHSNADYPVVREAMVHGFTQMTHFYSAMSGMSRRQGVRVLGMIECGYLFDELNLELIADGMHLPPELLRLILKNKDHDHLCLVTDSMRGAGMPEGRSVLGSYAHGIDCVIEGGVAHMPDYQSFAGSVATTDRLVRVMYHQAGVPLQEAVRMASLNPARFIGKDDLYGSIAVGKSADLLVFDEDINIEEVFVSGRKVSMC